MSDATEVVESHPTPCLTCKQMAMVLCVLLSLRLCTAILQVCICKCIDDYDQFILFLEVLQGLSEYKTYKQFV